MKSSLKRILPIVLVIVVLCSIAWYLLIYDKSFTQDMLLRQARYFEENGNHALAVWLYDAAYQQSENNEDVAIELAQRFKENGNYTKAEYTLSNAISKGGSVELYIALCQTYVEQNKLLDAVTMLDNVSDRLIRDQLKQLRPSAPKATPEPGFYSQYITVTLNSSSGTIYAANDGEYPSMKTDIYTDGIALVGGENTIYAVSVGDNGLVSPLSVLGYTVGGVIEEVTLADSALDALIREMLGFAPEDKMLTSDLWVITELTMPKGVADFSDLQRLPYLTKLTIDNSSVSDLKALSALVNLTHLTVTNTVVSQQDLALIASLPNLTHLTMSGCQLSSIQNLSGAHKLQNLDLNNNTIRDISALSFMTELTQLNLSHNALTSLNALSGLRDLKLLDVSYNSLASLVPLGDCVSLEELYASNNSIGNLSGVNTLVNLKKLDAGSNKLTDVEILSGNTGLVELTVNKNTLLDIAPLTSLNKLQYLDFSHNEIKEIPQWSKDCALVHFNGANNKISNVTPLSGLANLNTVILDNNKISNVNPLADCHMLYRVDVTGNPVKNVSKLTENSIIVNYTSK